MGVAGLQVDPMSQINYTKSIKNMILIILNSVIISGQSINYTLI
jgi:hypothetical protein